MLDYYLSDGKVQRCIGTPKGSLRVNTDKKIKRSAIYCDKWDSESNWTYSEMELSPFSGGNMNAGVALAVYRSDGEYYYKIKNSYSKSKYTSGAFSLTFKDKKYKAGENFTVPEDADIYKDGADFKYNRAALSVPVEFILNDDGSVSFGPSVYEWVKNWRDYVVKTYGGSAYEEKQ